MNIRETFNQKKYGNWIIFLILSLVVASNVAILYEVSLLREKTVNKDSQDTTANELHRMFVEAVSDRSKDEKEKNAALFENVFRRIPNLPESYADVWAIYEKTIIENSVDPTRTNSLYKIFLDKIEEGMFKAQDIGSFDELWRLHDEIKKKQIKFIEDEIDFVHRETKKSDFRDEVKKYIDGILDYKNSLDVKSPAILNHINFLAATQFNIEELQEEQFEHLSEIKKSFSEITEEKLDESLDRLEKRFDNVKNLTVEHPDNIEPVDEGDATKIITELSELSDSIEESSASEILALMPEEKLSSLNERIGHLYEECNKLANARYNLWANKKIEDYENGPFNSDVATEIAKVDRGLLHPAVDGLYINLQQKMLTETHGVVRVDCVRAFTLKVGTVTQSSF